jgi:hypothetical protein
MTLKQLEPDKFYFTVDCAECKGQIAFAVAPSPEENSNPRQRTVTNLKCPACGYTGTYAPALMYVAQGPDKKKSIQGDQIAPQTPSAPAPKTSVR